MSKKKKIKDPFANREKEKYDSPIPSREYILAHLSECQAPRTYEQLLTDLQLDTADDKEALRRRLIAMLRDGQLLKNRKGAFGAIDEMELMIGRVTGHKDGFGFIVPEDTSLEDLFLTPRQMRDVMHGDRVLARVVGIDSRGRKEAMIVEVLERSRKQLVGRYVLREGASYVEPAHQRIQQDIFVPLSKNKGAEQGQMVVVALDEKRSLRERPSGEIIEVLGEHMAPGMEIDVAIRNHELPYEFPDEVYSEAEQFPAELQKADYADRKDLRELPFVTIDGEDAKDFDDAVYVEKNKKGFKLFVAIADVSHYVKPGTMLDREAYLRSNSVYFPGRVLPMLPEQLSNHLCSLNPKVDRLVMVCEMDISPSGKINHATFYPGVIHSKERLTYGKVHSMLVDQDEMLRHRFSSVLPHLENLRTLYQILRSVREARGAIDFDLPETRIVFDRDKKIKKIVPAERLESHRIIEECMLAANISAAHFLETQDMPTLYRVHEGPKPDKIKDLQSFLTQMGLGSINKKKIKPSDYAHILNQVKSRPDAQLIQMVLLRSMGQAVYSPNNKGHFGLAYDAYAHFTSPIRRYPDLLVHRAIKKAIGFDQVKKTRKSKIEPALDFLRLGEHCSMTERRADEAVREVVSWLKCEFMMDKVGKVFSGRISGVTGFGIFVTLTEIDVEGLVHISHLPSDYYQFDAVRHELQGRRSGQCYQLGAPVRIQVARVDLDQCQIEFALESEIGKSDLNAAAGKSKSNSNSKPKSKKSNASKSHASKSNASVSEKSKRFSSASKRKRKRK